MIPGNASPLLLASAAAAAADDVATKSLRFNSGDSAYLNRTPSTAGNRKTWTWSAWVKRTKSSVGSTYQTIFSSGADGNNNSAVVFDNSDRLEIWNVVGNANVTQKITSRVFRDFSSWYHFVVSATSSTLKLYVNGAEVTDWDTDNEPGNEDWSFSSANAHYIGHYWDGGSNFKGDFYLADIYFIDGSALDATSFGAFDANGVWQASGYSGTYGTNGFHLLDFASESTVGHDSSGNENDFTANNLTTTAPSVYSDNGSITNNDGRTDQVGSFAAVFNGTMDANSSNAYGFLSGTFDFTWNLSTAISYSNKVEVWTGFGNGSVYLNGGSAVSSNNNNWTTLVSGSSGTISSIRFTTSGNGGWWAGVRVDGTVLVDGDPADLDVLFDVPTNGDQSDTGAGGEVSGSYCCWNPLALQPSGHGGLRQGNLEIIADTAGSHKGTLATFALPSTGKYYWEVKAYRTGGTNNGGGAVGVAEASAVASTAASGTRLGEANSSSWVLGLTTFDALHAGTADYSDYLNGGTVEADTGIIGIAVDMDNDKMWMHYNGTYGNAGGTGNPATGANPMFSGEFSGLTIFPAAGVSVDSGSGYITANWGQRSFSYSAPSGFKALCTTNLPTPTIADGSDYFEAKLFTGNGSTQTISGLSMSPDWVWIKTRSHAQNHGLFDTVRGAGRSLRSSTTGAEQGPNTGTDGDLRSFTSDGFTLGDCTASGAAAVNVSSQTQVAWCWDAGSSTVSNTDGSITSSVRASQTAGFSVVTFTGTGANATVGHGLNAEPYLLLTKCRESGFNWAVYHKSKGNTGRFMLNNTLAFATSSTFWNDTTPTSSVFSVGSFFASGNTFVAYCIAPVAGYSSVGQYTGNGSSSGPFVHTGHRIRWLMVRRADSTGSWVILDTARTPFNPADTSLYADTNGADYTPGQDWADMLSNGFKVRATYGEVNASGGSYIYYAVAENPFQANGGLAR